MTQSVTQLETQRVYLDYNATAPVPDAVVDAVAEALRNGGNASSIHEDGRRARAMVEEARAAVARLIGAGPDQITFTGSGTEASNQILRTCGRDRVIVSAIEHEAVTFATENPEILPVLPSGVVDLDALEAMLSTDGRPAVVGIMLANNETGVIQPVADAARIAHAHGALLHCDAVQALGKIPVDTEALGADSYAFSAHKIGGPQGIGVLVLRTPGIARRFVHGGGQERGLRAGTESVAAIVGFCRAAALAAERLEAFGQLAGLRDEMVARLRDIAPEVVLFGEEADRLPNTAKISMPGVSSETQVMAMDLAGISLSAGSACSSGTVEPPYVLTAMGVPDDLAITAIRVSMGWDTVPADIERFIDAWGELYERAGRKAA